MKQTQSILTKAYILGLCLVSLATGYTNAQVDNRSLIADLFVTDGNRLCTNLIDPVSKSEENPCACDPCGTTCIGGKVGAPKKVMVNRIDPLTVDEETGDCVLDDSPMSMTTFGGDLKVGCDLVIKGMDIGDELAELRALLDELLAH